MNKTLADTELLSILPDSIAGDSNVEASAIGIDPELRNLIDAAGYPAVFFRIDELTTEQLDHLALSWDIWVWRDYWPIDVKRSVLKAVSQSKAHMGTLKAVKDVLASLGGAASIKEWWQETPKADAHTFKIDVALSELDGMLDIETQEDLIDLLDKAKPVWSHYVITITKSLASQMKLTCYGRPMVEARLHSY